MFGSFIGNVAGISYFLAFQILGILLALYLFQKEKTGTTLLFGSVFGSFALHWLPTIYAFFFQFSVKAHLFAFITFVAIVWAVLAFGKEHTLFKGRFKSRILLTFPRKSCFISLASFIYLYLLCTFACYHSIHQWKSAQRAEHIRRYEYALRFYYKYCQAKNFPAGILLLPGTKLAYPFLSDSISSSVYIWGTSLRTAYLLPMFFALIQVFSGVYLLAKKIMQYFGGSIRGKKFSCYRSFLFQWRFRLLLLHEQGAV